ncbi:MAG: hypothetical protein JRE64_17725, partial [Deltaproteobacteria bacterium]|nr:hypothetical protein [Deltaproteobacteria bacterium]
STLAQLKRVEVLIALDRFEVARSVLESGRAGYRVAFIIIKSSKILS